MLVIIVAGIGLIPKEYGEAAEVFGASRWQAFRRITLPLLRPSLQTALILRVIMAFEVFAVVSALSGTTFPVLMGETYRYQFDLQDGSVAAAIAMVILAISIVFTLFFIRVLRGITDALVNSILVASVTMVMSILIGAPAGYALSRFDFRGKEVFRVLVLMTRAFPLPLLALPLAVMFIRTGLDDTIFGLALVHTTLAMPFAILITFSLFSGIPIELEEAAWTLGCNRLQAFRKALHSIDMEIQDQEFMVLLGASGCGKSTLLRIIAGLETQSEGEVWIGGKRVDHLSPRDRGIAMVFQNYAVFPHLTVFENIAFGLRMKKLDDKIVKERVERNAELMHITPQLQRYSGQLSGGQRQRVAVARALAMEPDVILMDEPLSNLDALLRMEMRAELKGILAASKTTTIYVTHDQVEAMSLADRISIMHQGHMVQSTDPVEVYRNPATRFVGSFIGNPPMNFLAANPVGKGQWQVAGKIFDGPETDKKIEFAIRPEDLVETEQGLEATVRVVEPLGAHTLVTCDVDRQLFRAILDSRSDVKAGDVLYLSPQQERIRWYDTETDLAV
ncbi:unnamed protein product [Cyprideis torosa]|uniref:Uncharacterized protein n=1 Tax=Cyprideis torosa TaxID=163714 RepID=A0A7R8WQ21_9CRUS|nr:unnamed protein product [Cyprideis torosa]CAG0901955.1 unnamed protein product [Cyprideis torosa]